MVETTAYPQPVSRGGSVMSDKISYKLTPLEHGRVEVAAHLRGQSFSAYVRDAVQEYLQENPPGKFRINLTATEEALPLSPRQLPNHWQLQLDKLPNDVLMSSSKSLWISKSDDPELIRLAASWNNRSVSEFIRLAILTRLERDGLT